MSAMTQQVSFKMENQKRIEAVEKSFRPAGIRLLDPDRVLIGEGRLMKQSRRGPQPKAFFLFNDMLVYGSIVINGRWFKRQKVIPLENLELEDLEDGYQMKHQWLLKTPQKSFYVSAASREEKQAWMEHTRLCKSRLLQGGGRTARSARSTFAPTWIPDLTSAECMMRCCENKFTFIHRRHHCRKCGFLVCGECSRNKAVLDNMHPTKQQRVCEQCHGVLSEEGRVREEKRLRWDSEGMRSDEEEQSCDEQEYEEDVYHPIFWATPGMNSFSEYVYLDPKHIWVQQ